MFFSSLELLFLSGKLLFDEYLSSKQTNEQMPLSPPPHPPQKKKN